MRYDKHGSVQNFAKNFCVVSCPPRTCALWTRLSKSLADVNLLVAGYSLFIESIASSRCVLAQCTSYPSHRKKNICCIFRRKFGRVLSGKYNARTRHPTSGKSKKCATSSSLPPPPPPVSPQEQLFQNTSMNKLYMSCRERVRVVT